MLGNSMRPGSCISRVLAKMVGPANIKQRPALSFVVLSIHLAQSRDYCLLQKKIKKFSPDGKQYPIKEFVFLREYTLPFRSVDLSRKLSDPTLCRVPWNLNVMFNHVGNVVEWDDACHLSRFC